MMELVRGHEEKINFARMMYLLSRLEPTEEGPKKKNTDSCLRKCTGGFSRIRIADN